MGLRSEMSLRSLKRLFLRLMGLMQRMLWNLRRRIFDGVRSLLLEGLILVTRTSALLRVGEGVVEIERGMSVVHEESEEIVVLGERIDVAGLSVESDVETEVLEVLVFAREWEMVD